MYVFNPHTSLTIVDSPITISSSEFFDVSIEAWAIDSSDEVKALSVPRRKCLLVSVSNIELIAAC